jgi:hypothetical protein
MIPLCRTKFTSKPLDVMLGCCNNIPFYYQHNCLRFLAIKQQHIIRVQDFDRIDLVDLVILGWMYNNFP